MKTAPRPRKGRPASAAQNQSWLQKSTELGMAVPQVVSHRVASMAAAEAGGGNLLN
jgi:hypothetical protein